MSDGRTRSQLPASADASPARRFRRGRQRCRHRFRPELAALAQLACECVRHPEQVELKDLLGRVRPLHVEHWDAALAGDAAAAVALALRMSGVDVLDTARHDLVMSMVLVHALAGSAAARTVLAFTLDRRRYLGENVDPLVRSWRGPSRTEIRRAAIQALMEALS